jgi:hypothetical protein
MDSTPSQLSARHVAQTDDTKSTALSCGCVGQTDDTENASVVCECGVILNQCFNFISKLFHLAKSINFKRHLASGNVAQYGLIYSKHRINLLQREHSVV